MCLRLLTIGALREECEGLVYNKPVVTHVNPHQSKCWYAQRYLEVCGPKAARPTAASAATNLGGARGKRLQPCMAEAARACAHGRGRVQ